MRIIFLGTADFAVSVLIELFNKDYQILQVVTPPDKPAHRGYKLTPSPVKVKALELKLEILQPPKLKEESFLNYLKNLDPDLIITADFGKLIPSEILKIPKLGCLGLHPSLLPKYRGATPIESAILNGETITGNTVFFIAEEFDKGDIILQSKVEISPEDTGGSLRKKLASSGAKLLIEAIEKVATGNYSRILQDPQKSSYAPRFKSEDFKINWQNEAYKINNQVRAFNPKPGAFTYFRGKLLKIFKAQVKEESFPNTGEIAAIEKDMGMVIATGSGSLLILEVQMEGKSKMLCSDFVLGYKPSVGEKL